jgi:AAA family ATP:ADP antiporter
MQQGLIFAYGSIIGALPVLVCCHSAIAVCWLLAVNTLAARRAEMLDSEIKEGTAQLEV